MSVPASESRFIWIEVIALFLAGLLVLGLSRIAGLAGGMVGELGASLTPLFFFAAPIWIARRRGLDLAHLGLHAQRAGAGLAVALVAAAMVFPPYAVGYELWSRAMFDAPLNVPEHPLTYYSGELRGRPDPLPRQALAVWVEGERFFALNTTTSRIDATITNCGCPAVWLDLQDDVLRLKGRPTRCVDGEVMRVPLDSGRGVRCTTMASDAIGVSVSDPVVPVLSGGGAMPSAGGTFARTPWWLLEMLLIQVVGVALPEEVFYRGYVQSRLAPLFRRRVRLLGVSFGLHIVVASALFALSHLVLIPAPFRLAVFFPGLLFGYLRERTGSVVAPIILHGLSNVLLELLIRFHG